MLPMKDTTAREYSIELAKILCETRGENYPINADSANEIADFIETLQMRFMETYNARFGVGSAKSD